MAGPAIGESWLHTGYSSPPESARFPSRFDRTEEGFDDAAGAFPRAETISVTEAPLASESFAEALRRFCEGQE